MTVTQTKDDELSRFAKSSVGDVVRATRVVAGVTQSRLTDDQVAFVRDDEVDVSTRVDHLAVLQPKHLQRTRRSCNFEDYLPKTS